MAKKQPRRRKKAVKRQRPSRFKSFKNLMKRALLWSLLIFGFLFCSYVGYQDYTVRKLFEGKRWSIPAYVYANPDEFYAGYSIGAAEFEQRLINLRYRKDARLTSEGSYHRSGDRIELKSRHFRFWDQAQPSQSVALQFSGATITQLTNLANHSPLALLRLDPIRIGSFYPAHKEDRILIQLDQVPDALINGLMATEDRDFYHHFGISVRGIARAMWANLRSGKMVQGGSTITQQLVKNLYLSPERSLRRKVHEAIIALILEFRYSKDQILEAYLNEIYLGQDGARAIHGFGLASQFYFNRSLDDLKLHHIALLVAQVRGPGFYNPRSHPEAARKRRDLVLTSMHQQGAITKKQASAAAQKGLDVSRHPHYSANRFPAFIDLVRRQLSEEYREKDLTSEGLKIFTTLEMPQQQALEKSVTSTLKQLEKRRRVNKLQSSAVVTRREGGEVVALVGGRDLRLDGFNRALDMTRQVGSVIKPVIYLTALSEPQRYTITTPISDRPVNLKGANGKVWSPQNADRKSHGLVPLHTALERSYNQAAVHLGMDLGLARVVKTVREMGVSRSIKLYPSLLLGAVPMTPLELTQLYQTLAGDGFATPLRAIRAVISGDSRPLRRYPLTVRQTVDPAAVYITNTILQQVMRRGTGRSVYSMIPKTLNVAGKTGTTNRGRDSWFAGFSGDYLSVVWVGRDDNKPTGLTGSSGALKVWGSFMKKVSRQPVDLIAPESVETIWIDPRSGLRGDKNCPGAVQYPYIKGSAPSRYSLCVKRGNGSSDSRSWFQFWTDE